MPAPWGRSRERWGRASLSAASSLEDRGGGANAGGYGPCYGGGSFTGQLIILLGAGFQNGRPAPEAGESGCGRLTHHISLPYSIIGQGHVDSAIKDTYCKRICGDCRYESTETAEECKGNADTQPDTAPAVEGDTGHAHHHGRHDGADQQGVRQQGMSNVVGFHKGKIV
ncbi:hypothetical protein F7725_012995 [Dissostichus mawsoni]|uniref:Selenoprotein P N-terminal domain-containing protein n=1 Tax=Dissostichus mawsoni TaxID=36200 RepID=A0A7J5YQ18_DISMA|nr:hypothetical protein F7725_012995 [Dissostichus mawsoni]